MVIKGVVLVGMPNTKSDVKKGLKLEVAARTAAGQGECSWLSAKHENEGGDSSCKFRTCSQVARMLKAS